MMLEGELPFMVCFALRRIPNECHRPLRVSEEIARTSSLLGGIDLLLFKWRIRYHDDMSEDKKPTTALFSLFFFCQIYGGTV